MTKGTAYGLYMCRGDVSSHLCGQCVRNATKKIASECRLATEAVIWYNHCWLRYSNQKFFSSVGTSPRFRELNVTNTNPVNYYDAFTLISNELNEMANKTGDSAERYQIESLRLNANQTLYILAQCTTGISSDGCSGCLSDVINSIPWSRLGSVGGRVLYPSCNLRFELFRFYDLVPPLTGYDFAWRNEVILRGMAGMLK
ncbi:Cysteine-rich receptor protein kinase 25 [Spatholobus suberectus]|nr:Cysteine-rich receptor protein kinase 25 [Spatholobus suberectus]